MASKRSPRDGAISVGTVKPQPAPASGFAVLFSPQPAGRKAVLLKDMSHIESVYRANQFDESYEDIPIQVRNPQREKHRAEFGDTRQEMEET